MARYGADSQPCFAQRTRVRTYLSQVRSIQEQGLTEYIAKDQCASKGPYESSTPASDTPCLGQVPHVPGEVDVDVPEYSWVGSRERIKLHDTIDCLSFPSYPIVLKVLFVFWSRLVNDV